MAQGQDRIASSLLELEPTAIIELFLLYFNTVDSPNSFIALHGGSVYNQGIVWQGVEYLPVPIETDGFEVHANGQLARPKMRISNKDYLATDLLIRNDDLQFAKVIRKRTFVKYLDDINFDGGNPWGDADASAELSSDTFVVGQKTAENKIFVELELTSPLDLENFEANNRLVMSKYCSWYYRGNGCNYRGIPLATEEGKRLGITDPVDWFQNQALKEWTPQRTYASGEAVYIENKKIIISIPNNLSKTEFAKIWYVCQSGHTSSLLTVPDKNPSLWMRDGCNKKLDGCKLRFGKSDNDFEETFEERTAYFVDFTSRTGKLRYNNISPNASVVTGSSQIVGYEAKNLVDMKLNTSWRTSGATQSGASVGLQWHTPQNINRVDLYNSVGQFSVFNYSFNNATVNLYDIDDFLIDSATTTISNQTNRSTVYFSGSPLVKSIIVTGSGQSYLPSLSEVAVFETNSPYMTYRDQENIRLHANDFFQISTWVGLSGRDNTSQEIYSVFHNISGNCRYSGINLYISGKALSLDFATRTTGANPQEIERSLRIPWNNDELKPIHLLCSGGQASGLDPINTTPGYIQLSDGLSQTGTFILSGSVGEYFKFKNLDYQNGIQDNAFRLKFGINDWQFPTGGEFTANPYGIENQVEDNIKIISPIKFGLTAFWTGAGGEDVRIANSSQSAFNNYQDFEKIRSNRSGLLGWWEMQINDGGSGIKAENNFTKKLFIVANSPLTENTPLSGDSPFEEGGGNIAPPFVRWSLESFEEGWQAQGIANNVLHPNGGLYTQMAREDKEYALLYDSNASSWLMMDPFLVDVKDEKQQRPITNPYGEYIDLTIGELAEGGTLYYDDQIKLTISPIEEGDFNIITPPYNFSETKTVKTTPIRKLKNLPLPFGGFPGTERYD